MSSAATPIIGIRPHGLALHCDDIGGLDALSRETLDYAADFLDRPTDEIGCLGVALDFVFLGAGLLA